MDPEDYAWASRYRWSLLNRGYVVRTQRRGGRRMFLLHRELLGLEHGDSRQGEHRNRDKLDNRRSNLRIVDGQAENMQNISAGRGSSEYRGVSLDKRYGTWQARVCINGEHRHLGSFNSEERAAKVAAACRAEHMPYAEE